MIGIVADAYAGLFQAPALDDRTRETIRARADDAPLSIELTLAVETPMRLLLTCPAELGRMAAVAVHGPALPEETLGCEACDALCELANVVGGLLLADRFGGGEMGVPRALEPDERATLSAAVEIERDDGPVMGLPVAIQLFEHAAPASDEGLSS